MTRRGALKAVYWFGIALLLAEIVARIATFVAWKRPLWRHPEIAARLEQTRSFFPMLTVGVVIDRPEILPAPVMAKGGEGPPRITTFGELGADAFPGAPASELPRPGVVRIAFMGGSTTFDGYSDHVAELADRKFGAGRTEILNLGVPASHSGTTLLLMQRFLPRWKPHLVVVYHGFNDLVHYRLRARALRAAATGRASFDAPALSVPPASRGLWSLLFGKADGGQDLGWLAESVYQEPISNFWEMSRLAWKEGFALHLATFAAPSYAELGAEERDFYETDIRYLWPVLGSVEQYRTDLAEYVRRMRGFADRSRTPLIDTAQALRGGREVFRDNCHLTEAGRRRQGEVVFEALAPAIEALLARGAPPIVPRSIAKSEPLSTAELPKSHPRDGKCVQGPCPDDACFVPAGPAIYGFSEGDVDRILPRLESGIGFAMRVWFEDETPAKRVELSAFCIQRSEAPSSEHARCVAEGACPPYGFESGAAGLPAVLPTAIDAEALCAFRGGRLPTDAEIDAAARGGDARPMPWGERWTGKEANYCGAECPYPSGGDPADGFAERAPSGSFATASPFGLIDAAGNLWEWNGDCFHASSHRRVNDGMRDPFAPLAPECRRFLRGGSFRSYAGLLERRTPNGTPDTDVPTRGARCVWDFGTRHQPIPP